MNGAFADIGWVDIALAVVLAISVLVGLWRGLVFELLSLLGWVAAFIAAQVFAPVAAPWIPLGAQGSALNHALSLALVFVVALLLWAIAARLLRMLIHATPLQPIDRVLGGAFGLVRGAVLLLVVATLVMLTPAQRSIAWQQSRGAEWLATLLHGLKPVLPEALGRHLSV